MKFRKCSFFVFFFLLAAGPTAVTSQLKLHSKNMCVRVKNDTLGCNPKSENATPRTLRCFGTGQWPRTFHSKTYMNDNLSFIKITFIMLYFECLLIIDITLEKHFELTHCIRVHLVHTFSLTHCSSEREKKMDSINSKVIDHLLQIYL